MFIDKDIYSKVLTQMVGLCGDGKLEIPRVARRLEIWQELMLQT